VTPAPQPGEVNSKQHIQERARRFPNGRIGVAVLSGD
jgi:hypothetical protein